MTDLGARLGRALAGRYSVERELGRGGMAVVYLARDVRHGRRVALKVLAADLARALGTERFLREIGIVAGLTHPRIVPLLDSGEADGLLYYVMPFVEGESVRQRLAREKQLPVDDAVEVARQAATALAYAHGHGVVHRDIKPENILLAGGEALVADFGIASAVTAAGGSRLTESGIVLGTPMYMSPEQASGERDVDGRSDLYSLACVLYEMLVGEPPFTGPSTQAITARKLSQPPPEIGLVRGSVPQPVVDAVRKSLAPVPADRHDDAAQFAADLRRTDAAFRHRRGGPASDRRRWEPALWLALGAVAALLLAFAGREWSGRNAPASSGLAHLTAPLPPDVTVSKGPGYNASSVAISPDGRTLVIAGTSADGQRLYQRPLDRLEATPLAGTEGGSSPFFSPDGAWIGFFADGFLRRIPVGGGAAADITPVPGFLSGAGWTHDDRIVFGSGLDTPAYVVDASGGRAEALTRLEQGESGHSHPDLLPDGRVLLFLANGWIHALDLATGRRAALAEGSSPRYTASGHLIFGRGTVLLAAPFDPDRLELTGPAVPLVEAVAGETTGVMHYAISRAGALAYLSTPVTHSLVLVGADGRERLVTDEPLTFENPQFSPDGRRVAVATSRRLGEPTDIWVHDLGDGTASRLTFEGGRAPVWRPDGAAVTFSRLGERQGIYTRAVDGRGDAEQLLAIEAFHWPVGWTPDGNTLAFGIMERERGAGTWSSIMAHSDGETRRVIGSGPNWGGRLSPDGRWLAYYTQEAGRFEVYVTPFPGGSTRWLVSDEGGRDPTWGPEGPEIFYRSGDRLVAARIDTTAGVRVIARRLVLAPFSPPLYDDYDIHPDGRTLVLVRPRNESGRHVVVALDWLTEVRRATGARPR